MSKWFANQADDEVSSLGGDFPSHFSLEESTKTMAQVTSLFSSALTFTGQPKDSTNEVAGEHNQQQKTIKAKGLPRPPPPHVPSSPLLGVREESSEHSSSHNPLSQTEQEKTPPRRSAARAAVRTKTLLKGNLQIKRPRKTRKLASGSVAVPAVV